MIKHLIDGREVESKEVFETVNPATQEVLAEVASGGEAEIAAAVAAAKEAFPKWAGTPQVQKRLRALRFAEVGTLSGPSLRIRCNGPAGHVGSFDLTPSVCAAL